MTAGFEQVKVALALPKGPDELWKNACAYGALGFTVGDLAGCRYGLAYRTAEQWVAALKRQGKIKIVGARQTHGRTHDLYAVTRVNNMAPVVRRAAYEAASPQQQNMWNAMRRMSHFALQELCFAASTEGVTIHPPTASKYVSALTRAELIEVFVGAGTGVVVTATILATTPPPPQVYVGAATGVVVSAKILPLGNAA